MSDLTKEIFRFKHPSEIVAQYYGKNKIGVKDGKFKDREITDLSEQIFHLELDDEEAAPESDKDNNNLDDEYDVDRENEQQDSEAEVEATEQTKITPKDFQLRRLLGKGTFGHVYLVRKITGRDANKHFAMKMIKKSGLIAKPKHAEHTRAERNALATAKHPFIVELSYSFQTNDKLYLVMEYLSGGDMFQLLRRKRRLAVAEARFYSSEIISALGYLHALGIIHRDLKPENIVLDCEGHIKLTDFGLCKQQMQEGSATRTYCGSMIYMAPEIIANMGHDKAVDWWALGVLMFQMLVGWNPFYARSERETKFNILTKFVKFPSFLRPDVCDLMRRLLKRAVMERLGGGHDDAIAVQSHIFFKNTDWDDVVARRMTPPYHPPEEEEDEDEEEVSMGFPMDEPEYQLSSNDLHFKGFSYEAPSTLDENCSTNRNQDNF